LVHIGAILRIGLTPIESQLIPLIQDVVCVFRRKAAGDSDAFQPVIPTEASQ